MNALLAVIGVAAVWTVAWMGTRAAREYSIARAVLDVPNERSSHQVPTPRGGGIAICAAVLGAAAAGGLTGWVDARVVVALLGGVLVAGIGWLDDLRGVSARLRAAVHVAAAIWAVVWLDGLPFVQVGTRSIPLGAIGAGLAVIGIVWYINLYNFMDGIDGLAGMEGIAIGTFSAVILAWRGQPGLAGVAIAVAAACAGFLYWNWPPARIFMGDVGSGFLGYVFAVLALAAQGAGALPLPLSILLAGVFVMDATVTLLRRVARGEAWYAAHREHAYQRGVQSGWSHRTVTGLVLLVNLVLGGLAVTAAAYPATGVPVILAGGAVLVLLYLLVERRRPMTRTR